MGLSKYGNVAADNPSITPPNQAVGELRSRQDLLLLGNEFIDIPVRPDKLILQELCLGASRPYDKRSSQLNCQSLAFVHPAGNARLTVIIRQLKAGFPALIIHRRLHHTGMNSHNSDIRVLHPKIIRQL